MMIVVMVVVVFVVTFVGMGVLGVVLSCALLSALELPRCLHDDGIRHSGSKQGSWSLPCLKR